MRLSRPFLVLIIWTCLAVYFSVEANMNSSDVTSPSYNQTHSQERNVTIVNTTCSAPCHANASCVVLSFELSTCMCKVGYEGDGVDACNKTCARVCPPPPIGPPPFPFCGNLDYPPPLIMPPPPPPDNKNAKLPPPIMPPPTPLPQVENKKSFPPPIMPPPPPPPQVGNEKSSPPPIMPPPPPPPSDFDLENRKLPPPMMIPPPPPPPPELENRKINNPPPLVPPPPPPSEFEDEMCPDGFTRNLDTCTCIADRACETNSSLCGDHGRCVDGENNTYTCECFNGFEVINNYCDDVDECLSNPCPEPPLGSCSNLNGSYECLCLPDGYLYSNVTNTCSDVDECTANGGKGPCDTFCINTNGSFKCACENGFQLDSTGFNCTDVNECDVRNPCHQKCVNIAGSFECSCFDGFHLDNGTCVANVECGQNNCINGDCHMDAGNATCTCWNGYIADNATSCSDINECDDGTHVCHTQADCTNIPGSYSCTCREHYLDQNAPGLPDGSNCEELLPPIVANITGNDVNQSSATVRWWTMSSGDYFVVYLTNLESSDRFQEDNVTMGTLFYTFHGLSPNTSYTFNIATVKGEVISTTTTKAFTTKLTLTPPTFNRVNVIDDITTTSILVSWNAPLGSTPVDGYQLLLTTPGVATTTLTFPANTTQALLSNLKITTLYSISLATIYDATISPTVTINQYTAPDPPVNVLATPSDTYGDLKLSWDVPVEGSVTDYVVVISPTGPIFDRDVSNGTFGVVRKLVPGTPYKAELSSIFMNVTSVPVAIQLFVPITTTIPTSVVSMTTSRPVTSVAASSSTIDISEMTTAMVTSPEGTTSSPRPILCAPYFAPFDGSCIESQLFTVQITFIDEFNPNLTISTSSEAIAFQRRYNDVLSSLSSTFSFEVIVTTNFVFARGSTIVTADATLGRVTNTTTIQQDIDNDIAKGALDGFGVTKVQLMDHDECVSNEDDCHDDATCTTTMTYPGFSCTCNDGYRDNNPTNPGRFCETVCTIQGTDYCLNGGECAVLLESNLPRCKCTSWYAGIQCETINPVMVAAIAVGAVACVLLVVTVILITLMCVRRRKGKQGNDNFFLPYNDGSQTSNRSSFGKYRSSEADEESTL